jgi:hypothetical protein
VFDGGGQIRRSGTALPRRRSVFREHVNRADTAQLTLLAGILNDYGYLLRAEGHPGAAEMPLFEAMQFAPRWHGASRNLVKENNVVD